MHDYQYSDLTSHHAPTLHFKVPFGSECEGGDGKGWWREGEGEGGREGGRRREGRLCVRAYVRACVCACVRGCGVGVGVGVEVVS